jgi:hypothetical protein
LTAGLYFLLSNNAYCSGMAQTATLLFNAGYQLSNKTTYPGWNKGSEFKAIRENLWVNNILSSSH